MMLKRVKILDFIISGCILCIKISRTVFFLLSLRIILISSSSLFQSFIIYGKNEFLKYLVYSANLKKKLDFDFAIISYPLIWQYHLSEVFAKYFVMPLYLLWWNRQTFKCKVRRTYWYFSIGVKNYRHWVLSRKLAECFCYKLFVFLFLPLSYSEFTNWNILARGKSSR